MSLILNKKRLATSSALVLATTSWLTGHETNQSILSEALDKRHTAPGIDSSHTDIFNRLSLSSSIISNIYVPHKYSFISQSLKSYHNLPKKKTTIPTQLPVNWPLSSRVYSKEFIELNRLGRGAYGSVYRAKNLLDGNEYAIKKTVLQLSESEPLHAIDNTRNHHNEESTLDHSWYPMTTLSLHSKQFLREARVMAVVCRHRNLVRYYQAWIELIPAHSLSDPDDTLDDTFGSFDGISQSQYFKKTTTNSLCTETKVIVHDGKSSLKKLSSSDDRSVLPVLFIQMQLCDDTTLYDWLRFPNRTVNISHNMHFFQQLLMGLGHMHSKRILHRDIKPTNLLIITKDGMQKLKISDFGCSKHIDSYDDDTLALPMNYGEISRTTHPKHTSGCGTLVYMAPELSGSDYNEKVDVFAAGIVLFEMFHTFSTEMERYHHLQKLRDHHIIDRPFMQTYSNEADIVRRMTLSDPSQRPSVPELLNEAFKHKS